ncbi:GH92 family glycosyl hydrolase [Streptomyces sp. NBC_00441]|uniref:GH92 family glycosyl hydrolase n=1 Tax=Streptomyces sp. NBC_00441 TaxID=2975742 RepID=UPI002E2BAB1D|nr:GH92 family glycosyl hydrolase [Streptomyces sp. NBC_00441]
MNSSSLSDIRTVPPERRRWVRPLLAASLGLGLLLTLSPLAPAAAAAPTSASPRDPASLVDVFTGTAPSSPALEKAMGENFSRGNTHPAATAPFGMIQWGPDTVKPAPGQYAADDDRLKGFSLTHLSGGGCTAFGDVPVQPVPGDIGRSPATHPDDYAATFDHANQDAAPGSYHVRTDNGVDTRLAAGTRAAAGRFTFPAGHDGKGTVLLNTSGSANGAAGVTARVDGDRTVTGTVSSGGICSAKAPYDLSFRIEFDRPFTAHGTWQGERVHRTAGTLAEKDGKDGSGVYLTFDTSRHRAVNARVAISYTGASGAAANLAGTRHLTSVEDLAAATHDAWNDELRRIQVAGGSQERTRVFYTALYHCLLEPRTLNDIDGRYRGFDRKIHRVRPGHTWYGNFSGWDVYRTETPLLAFLAPDRASDMAQSMVDAADQSGRLPRWTLLNNQTNGMVGDPAPVMLASAWAFGARDFDLDGALKYAVEAATRTGPERPDGYVERQAVAQWRANGFLRNGDSPLGSSAATSLEYAVDDFAVARLAAADGDTARRRAFMRTAHNWQNLVDGADGTLGPRLADGTLQNTSNPASLSGFQEGSAAQYQWMTGPDLAALAAGMGGNRRATARLDEHFTEVDAGSSTPHAWIGNEITFGAPWAYHGFGAPNHTNDVVPRMLDRFTTGPAGLPGNDDLGALSAWYVWASVGLYPEAPGTAELALSTPAFPSVTIDRGSAGTLRIGAPRSSEDQTYVADVRLDGRSHAANWVAADSLRGDARLDYRLTSDRSNHWGTGRGDLYPSYAEGRASAIASVAPVTTAPGTTSATWLAFHPIGGRPGPVHWRLRPPAGVTVDRSAGVTATGGHESVRVRVPASTPPASLVIPVDLRAADGTRLPSAAIRVSVLPRGTTSVLPWADEAGTSTATRPVGDFNGYGGSFVAEELAEDGLAPGQDVTVDGIGYRWPDAAPGNPDNINAHGQTVTVHAPPGQRRLGLLGAGNEGASTGDVTVHYTDGTTRRTSVTLGDWHLDGATAPPPGNTAAATMPVRQMAGGTPEKMTVYIWATSVPVDPHRTVASVTLPERTTGGQMHVFAVGVGEAGN